MANAAPQIGKLLKDADHHCRETGYSGRLVVAEILPFTKDILRLLAEDAPLGAIDDQARKEGFYDLMYMGLTRVKKGDTSLDEIQRVIF